MGAGGTPQAILTEEGQIGIRRVGIDRCVFATVYTLSRQARGMATSIPQGEMIEVEAIFNSHTKPSALAKLQAAA